MAKDDDSWNVYDLDGKSKDREVHEAEAKVCDVETGQGDGRSDLLIEADAPRDDEPTEPGAIPLNLEQRVTALEEKNKELSKENQDLRKKNAAWEEVHDELHKLDEHQQEKIKNLERLVWAYKGKTAEQDSMIKKQQELIDSYQKQLQGKKGGQYDDSVQIQSAEAMLEKFKADLNNYTFDDIGGLASVLYIVRDFKLAIEHPEAYEQYGERPAKSILLYGPPGTGKTMVAQAMSTELDCFFYDLAPSEFESMWHSMSEKNLTSELRSCVNFYKETGNKVIIFVDEAEQVFMKRGNWTGHNTQDKILNVLLRFLNGTEDDSGLIYVLCTNRMEDMDEAVLRDCRIDYRLHVPIPDREGVEDILRRQVAYRNRKAGWEVYRIEDYGKLADMFYRNRATGANMAAVLKKLVLDQVRYNCERIQAMEKAVSGTGNVIKTVMPPIYQFQIEAAILTHDFRADTRKDKVVGF